MTEIVSNNEAPLPVSATTEDIIRWLYDDVDALDELAWFLQYCMEVSRKEDSGASK